MLEKKDLNVDLNALREWNQNLKKITSKLTSEITLLKSNYANLEKDHENLSVEYEKVLRESQILQKGPKNQVLVENDDRPSRISVENSTIRDNSPLKRSLMKLNQLLTRTFPTKMQEGNGMNPESIDGTDLLTISVSNIIETGENGEIEAQTDVQPAKLVEKAKMSLRERYQFKNPSQG